MDCRIVTIPGDGIGPEIVREACKVLDKTGQVYGHRFDYTEILMGGCSIDAYGVPLTEEALETARKSDAVLLGAVGGNVGNSRWYDVAPNLRPEAGLLAIRKLHMRVLKESGLSAADEMLYPENWWYLADLLSYVAVGARSVEDQHHRMTVSGFDIPAGMKNPTSGHMSVMLNSVVAAQHAHSFIYRGWDVDTDGNPLAHTILRGAVNKRGAVLPNYHYEDLRLLSDLYAQTTLQNPACIVDVNHSNSNKQYLEQIRISKEILHSRRYSDDIRRLVKGLMIESYIEDGCQGIHDRVYGKSITDPCLGWEKTERLIYDIAENC